MPTHANPNILSLRDQPRRIHHLYFQVLDGPHRLQVIASDLAGAVEVRWNTDTPRASGTFAVHSLRPPAPGAEPSPCRLHPQEYCSLRREPEHYLATYAALIYDDDLDALAHRMARDHGLAFAG